MTPTQKKNKEIADKLENLATFISIGKVNMEMLRDSISDLRYAVAKLKEDPEE